MKEISRYQLLLSHCLDSLNEIKCHLCNERPLEGGIEFGKLYN